MSLDNRSKYKFIFLDRDGVINIERKDDYVKNISEFVFEPEVLNAIALLSKLTDYIFIITNQRGVGKGVMSLSDLNRVHEFMLEKIRDKKGDVTHIYYCTDLDSSSINRKPNTGMAFRARSDYPEIEFACSVMVGNSRSDIEFGKKLGMYTVLIGSKYTEDDCIYDMADAHYSSLYEFALSL